MAELTEEDLAALGVSQQEFACPDCEFVGTSKAGLAQHRRSHRAAKREPVRQAVAAASDLVVEAVVEKTVANLQVLGGYVSILLLHTGLALAGVPGERESDPPIVQSRAIIAGRVLAKWAQRDERVLKALDRFNALFETSEAIELAAGIGAAVAVDTGLVDPHIALEIGPFTGDRAIQPVRSVIGDVVDYVDTLREEAQRQQAAAQQRPSPDGIAPDGAEIVQGGFEDT